jgi:flagellin-like protein
VKKIWKIRRDEEAVSPVIATILMVAITVVLAAVLYIMVTTMTGGGQATPVGSLNLKGDSNTGATSERLYFGSINPNQKPTACKIILFNTTEGTKIATYSFPTSDISGNDMAGGRWSVKINYTDLMDDKIISDGDYIDISGLVAAKSYKVTLVWIINGSEICSQTFTK